MPRPDAVEFLTAKLDRLTHPDGTPINMLPFDHDSPEVQALRRKVAEAVLHTLVADGGFTLTHASDTPADEAALTRTVAITCSGCRTETADLVKLTVDKQPDATGTLHAHIGPPMLDKLAGALAAHIGVQHG